MPFKFGELATRTGVAGIELLEAFEKGQIKLDDNGMILIMLMNVLCTLWIFVWVGDLVFGDDHDDTAAEVASSDDGNEASDSDADSAEWESEQSENLNIDDADSHDDSDSSDDGDSDDGEWISCSDDEEPAGEADADSKTIVAESSVPPIPLDRRRVLTSDDFDLIDRLKSAYLRVLKDPRARSSMKKLLIPLSAVHGGEDNTTTEGEAHGLNESFTVTIDTLAPQAKTGKSSKIDRMTRILEGRKENKFDIGGHAGGLTNKEKLRQKNYIMVRKGKKSVANKSKESNSSVRYHNAHRVSYPEFLIASFFTY